MNWNWLNISKPEKSLTLVVYHTFLPKIIIRSMAASRSKRRSPLRRPSPRRPSPRRSPRRNRSWNRNRSRHRSEVQREMAYMWEALRDLTWNGFQRIGYFMLLFSVFFCIILEWLWDLQIYLQTYLDNPDCLISVFNRVETINLTLGEINDSIRDVERLNTEAAMRQVHSSTARALWLQEDVPWYYSVHPWCWR